MGSSTPTTVAPRAPAVALKAHRLPNHAGIGVQLRCARNRRSAQWRRPRWAHRRSDPAAGPAPDAAPSLRSNSRPPRRPGISRGVPRPTIVKSISENVPSLVMVFRFAPMSWISGMENVAFCLPDAQRALAKVKQPALVAVGKRAQQHRAHHAEDGRVGANAQRQGKRYRDPQCGHAGE